MEPRNQHSPIALFGEDDAAGKCHGFTLIELLAVIAIISILAAILFPVMAQAKEQAKQTSCLSDVRQLSLGVMMYLEDFDDSFPMGGWQFPQAPEIPTSQSRWYIDIDPYIRNEQVRICPSNRFKSNAMNTSYGLNSSLAPWEGSQSADIVSQASNLVLMADTALLDATKLSVSRDNLDPSTWAKYAIGLTGYQLLGPYVFCPPAVFPYTLPADIYGTTFKRPYPLHHGRVNVGFCDGHAKSLDNRALIGPMPLGFPLTDPRNLWSNN